MIQLTQPTARRYDLSFGVLLLAGIWQSYSVPAAGQPFDAVAAAGDEVLTERLATEPSAVARAILRLPRESPDEYFRAAVNLYDLGELDLASEILNELNALDVAPQVRSELVRQFGSHRMLQLARDPLLGPSTLAFTESCLESAAAQSRDPDRLATLVAKLGDPSPAVRHAAIVDLNEAGVHGVRYVAETLAREQNPLRRRHLSRAFASMQPLSIRPLLAMLSTNDPQRKEDVVRVLAYLKVAQAVPLLAVAALLAEPDSPVSSAAHSAFLQLTDQPLSPAVAQQQLLRAVRRYLDGVIPFSPDANNQIELWFWIDESGEFLIERYPREEARVIWAARLAEDLYRLSPARSGYRRLAVMIGLEAAKLRQGYPQSLAELSLAPWLVEATGQYDADPNELSRLLDASLETKFAGAATTVCELLEKSANQAVLATADGQPSPLVRALRDPDRRLSFAALRAITATDPRTPYPGSSQLPKALGRFARSTSERIALVAMPRLDQAATVGGLLHGAGFAFDVADHGRDVIQLARELTDAEFVLVDMAIDAPGIREVLYELRSMPSASGTPIGLLAQAGMLPSAQRLAAQHQGVVAFSRPHSADAAAAIADRMIQTVGRNFVPATERAEQASFAMDELARLLADGRRFYKLRPQLAALESGLYRPVQSTSAIRGLALLGTPESQRSLVDYVSRPAVPLASRELAAQAFRQSVAQHGSLLTSQEIIRQYDRYNSSDTADAGTQQALSLVLDGLESRRRP